MLAAVLCLAQVLWWAVVEWSMLPLELVGHGLILVLGAGAAIASPRRWLRALGFGLLLLEPCVVGIMTAVLGSVTPYGRTGIEMFGVFGFSIAAAFVLGYWINKWLERIAEGQDPRRLSPRALLGVVLLLCSPSILAALGDLLLQVSYPDGLIPADTPWGRAMVSVMLVSAPAALTGIGLLVLAAPIAVYLIRSMGVSSRVGRTAVGVGLLALVSAAVTLNR
jgi:hypothetical protein